VPPCFALCCRAAHALNPSLCGIRPRQGRRGLFPWRLFSGGVTTTETKTRVAIELDVHGLLTFLPKHLTRGGAS
jgi:hypothetical protein